MNQPIQSKWYHRLVSALKRLILTVLVVIVGLYLVFWLIFQGLFMPAMGLLLLFFVGAILARVLFFSEGSKSG